MDLQVFSGVATAAFIIVASYYLSSYALPSPPTIGYLPSFPSWVKLAKSAIHPILIAHLGFAYFLAGFRRLGRTHPCSIGNTLSHSLAGSCRLFIPALIIVNPLQSNCARPIASRDVEGLEPIPGDMVADTKMFRYLFNAKIILIVKALKKLLNRFIKLFFDFYLSTPPLADGITSATTKVCFGGMTGFDIKLLTTRFARFGDTGIFRMFFTANATHPLALATKRAKSSTVSAIWGNPKLFATYLTNYIYFHRISNEKRPAGKTTLLSRKRIPNRELIYDYTMVLLRYLDTYNYSTFGQVRHAS